MPIAILILNKIKLISAFGMKIICLYFFIVALFNVFYAIKTWLKVKNILKNVFREFLVFLKCGKQIKYKVRYECSIKLPSSILLTLENLWKLQSKWKLSKLIRLQFKGRKISDGKLVQML